MGATTMARIADGNAPFQATHKQHMMRLGKVATDGSVLGTLAKTYDFAATALLNCDYKRCAETMINKYGSNALVRAEKRARQLLGDHNHSGYDIWSRVAATIRGIR
jgi:hypothetical protein